MSGVSNLSNLSDTRVWRQANPEERSSPATPNLEIPRFLVDNWHLNIKSSDAGNDEPCATANGSHHPTIGYERQRRLMQLNQDNRF
jgi:hypothetical protein